MELPVDNRNRIVAYILTIFFLVIVLSFVLYINIYNVAIIYIGLFIIILEPLIGVFLVRKHDIKKATLMQDVINIQHRVGLIKIPIEKVINIKSGLNYFIEWKGNMSFTYILQFSTKYVFGDKLYLKYNFDDVSSKNEPEDILILRENMNKRNYETS